MSDYSINQQLKDRTALGKEIAVVVLTLCLIAGSFQTAFGAVSGSADSITGNLPKVEKTIKDTIQKLIKNGQSPTIGTVGGDWLVIGIARSGQADQSESKAYIEQYEKNASAFLKECGGVLSERKYTEYARVVLAMTAIGKNPMTIEGYNLVSYLEDYDKCVYQGVNGASYALIALDSGNYNTAQETRTAYIKFILDRQLDDGGFALTGTVSDPDVTAMALQALAKYTDQSDVAAAVEKALGCLSKSQNAQGGYTAWGETNSETTAQVITALCELGIDPADPRFVKNGNTLLDNLMSYAVKDGFAHAQGDTAANQMAGEQALYALVSYERYLKGDSSISRMTVKDTSIVGESETNDKGSVQIPYQPVYDVKDVKLILETLPFGICSVGFSFL